jgi:UDP-N-acetylmuramate dehydrogenase
VHDLGPVSFADLTTLRLGGPAARVLAAETSAELVEAVTACDRAGEPVLVLGAGSNLVVADAGFEGTVVRVASTGVLRSAAPDGPRVAVTALAGESWDALVAATVSEGLAGLETLSGIPGLTGATPIQNVGAYGADVSDTVQRVEVLDRVTGRVGVLAGEDCRFTYRNSRFKGSDRYVVLAVTFGLERSATGAPVRYAELADHLGVAVGGRAPVSDVRRAVLELRARKGMVLDPADHDTWSAGSFFTNPVLPAELAAQLPPEAPRWPEADGRVKVSAAWLIEQAGFAKGHGAGPVRLSTKHTLALTNRGSARTADLLTLAREIRDGVRARFGVELAPEPVLLGCAL